MRILQSLGIGVLVILLSLILLKVKQKSITSFGIRIPLAQKNLDTWNEANHFFGIVGTISGIICIVAGVLYDLKIFTDIKIILYVFIILMVLCIIFTQIHLTKTFDKDGKRIN
ncbi:SdpI family protein [Clostridium felsineum]|uniref:SdpI family protein n=1 Tax=Clostridium felsineum TaxID=36839 RepID=UPI00098CA151|nr:SdpI family protein [Clostridium felsineum]URZ03669.1 hypothetical protein CLAUR_037300 [Clostridium felsineum]